MKQPEANLPQHIAIIMDGNNRYAKKKQLAQGGGHRAGKDSLDPIVEHCRRIGIRALTVFAFSSENWQRPPEEVALLMLLLEETIIQQVPRMLHHGIALRFIGDRSLLSERLQALMQSAEQQTVHFAKQMTLTIAISYGGMWDIVQAAKRLLEDVQQGRLSSIDGADIDEYYFNRYTCLSDLPKVDMLIRTGGEYRLSNFLIWQSAYAELFFTKTLWPDFAVAELEDLIQQFGQRERRFGQTSEQIQAHQKTD